MLLVPEVWWVHIWYRTAFSTGHEILGSYYKPTTNINDLNPVIRMIECDVRYYESVFRIMLEFQPDQMYHLAAQSYPTVSWLHLK